MAEEESGMRDSEIGELNVATAVGLSTYQMLALTMPMMRCVMKS